MPPLTPNFPAWIDGDLLSASKLNDLMDWIDTGAPPPIISPRTFTGRVFFLLAFTFDTRTA